MFKYLHYYPHIIEFDIQNCQLSIKVHFLECYGRQIIRSIIFSLVGVFEYITFFKYPYKKKFRLDKSGNLGHHDTSPPRPIRLSGNVRSKWYLTFLLQFAGVSSC